MTNQIEFIALLELPTLKDEESQKTPEGTPRSNPKAWDEYQKRELAKNYKDVREPIEPSIYQYPLSDLSDSDIRSLIRLHVSDLKVEDSCSFFGGLGLSIDGQIVLYPQCCGLIDEISDWNKLLTDEFAPFYLMECHPSPKFEKVGTDVHIVCDEDETGPFTPPTESVIVVDHKSIRQALKKMNAELVEFSERLDTFSKEFESEQISKALIWGK